jgi:hypothetical protein
MLSIAAAFAADKEPAKLNIRPAADYPAHQTNSKVTVAAAAYVSDDDAKPAFGKNNPYQYGVLPVLVVIQNDSDQAMRVDRMKMEYTAQDRDRVQNTPASEVKFLRGPRKPDVIVGPTGGPSVKRRKNPLDSWEIEGRAFSAKMIPPGQSASGFVYFQTGYQRGSKFYLTGISEASSGKDLFYYELLLLEIGK